MKKLLGILAVAALASSAFAQGTVTLNNQTGLVKQWTSASDQTAISVPKSTGYVQLIAAPTSAAALTALFTPVTGGLQPNYSSLAGFLAANPQWALPAGTAGNPAPATLIALGNGVFNGQTRTIANITGAVQAQYALLGWTGAFTTFDEALLSGTSFMGLSAIATSATADPLASPPGTPISLSKTFAGMTLAPVIVPEPTSFALAGLGLAALLVFRRRS